MGNSHAMGSHSVTCHATEVRIPTLPAVVLCCVVNSVVITYNAALNKPSYQSSVHRNRYGDYSAHLANDGSRETTASRGYVPRCSISEFDTNPWWAVDVGRPIIVYRVDFTSRGDGNVGMKKCVCFKLIILLVIDGDILLATASTRKPSSSSSSSLSSFPLINQVRTRNVVYVNGQ